MVKNFSGQVKIEDVQAEFDALVSRINTMVDSYNKSGTIKDHDYSVGGSTLAPSGYTLTIGGIKQVLQNYDGCVFGCKPFKVSENSVKVTDGILITDTECFKINGKTLSGQGDTIYYDDGDNQLKYAAGSAISYVSWTQPTISSNTTWGQFSANVSSSNAWRCTLSNSGGNQYNVQGFPISTDPITITWKFGATLQLASISFKCGLIASGGRVTITALNGATIATQTLEPENTSVSVDTNVITNGIKISFSGTSNNVLLAVGDLVVLGKRQVIGSGSTQVGNLYKVCDLNWNRGSNAIEDNPNIQFENFSTRYKITTVAKEINEDKYNNLQNNGENLDTSSSGKFVWGNEQSQWEGSGTAYVNLFGTRVAQNNQTGHSNKKYWAAPSFLYIPKGISNPYTYNKSSQVVFNSKFTKS